MLDATGIELVRNCSNVRTYTPTYIFCEPAVQANAAAAQPAEQANRGGT